MIRDINENKPHTVSEVICINCKHRWIAVRPSDMWLKDIKCPYCNNKGYVINTGQGIEEDT